MTYDKIWASAVSLILSKRDHLFAVAGVFIFLPVLAMTLFFPLPKVPPIDPNGVQAWSDYIRLNGNYVLLSSIVQTVGTGAILTLMLRSEPLTAGQAIVNGVKYLPGLFLYNLLFGLAAFGGLAVFVIPGLYIIGRFALGTCSIIDTQTVNPFRAFAASFKLTQGRGWYVFGMLLIIFAVVFILSQITTFILAGLAALIFGANMGTIVAGIVQALFSVFSALVYASIYVSFYCALSGGQDGDVRSEISRV
jgi:hypothetical protein